MSTSIINTPLGGLVDAQWLADNLDDPNLRIIDATLFARLGDNAVPIIESGLEHWQAGHITGAIYVHPAAEASNLSANLPVMAPTLAQFEHLISRLDIDKANRVVIYSAENPWWATRMWWVFHIFGFDNVSVLNGGYANWCAGGHPLTTGVIASATTASTKDHLPHYQPDLVAERADVLKATTNSDTVLINTLEPSVFSGEDDPGYGRPGHITGSINLPSSAMYDPGTLCFIARAEMEKLLASAVPDKTSNIICYCGSGVAASIVVFALNLCEYENVQLYDAGLRDWVRDASLPMTTETA